MRVATRLSRTAWLPCISRPFSSTAARRSAIPEFVRSSNGDLYTTLQQARDQVIIPKHLTPKEASLVWRPANQKLLLKPDEPVMKQIGGTTVQLKPLDASRQNPSPWYVLKTVLKLSETKDDWTNVERLLVSYHKAGIQLENWMLNSLLRKVWVSGQHDMVLRLLERAHETGIRLRTLQLLSLVLWGMRDIATSNGWAKQDVNRALTGTRQITELLESPEHAGGDRAVKPGDLRTQSITIAMPLELAAVQHIKYPSKDPEAREKAMEEVRQLAGRLMNNLKINGTSELTAPPDSRKTSRSPAYMERRYNKYKMAQVRMLRSIPVWHAIALSKRLLGSDLPEPAVAEQCLADIHAMITEDAKTVQEMARDDEGTENWSIRSWRACELVDEKR